MQFITNNQHYSCMIIDNNRKTYSHFIDCMHFSQNLKKEG